MYCVILHVCVCGVYTHTRTHTHTHTYIHTHTHTYIHTHTHTYIHTHTHVHTHIHTQNNQAELSSQLTSLLLTRLVIGYITEVYAPKWKAKYAVWSNQRKLKKKIIADHPEWDVETVCVCVYVHVYDVCVCVCMCCGCVGCVCVCVYDVHHSI